MGHYASEMPGTPWEAARDERFHRSMVLKERIKDLPIGDFRVCDLKPLIKIFGSGLEDVFEDELEQLEDRATEIESKSSQ